MTTDSSEVRKYYGIIDLPPKPEREWKRMSFMEIHSPSLM